MKMRMMLRWMMTKNRQRVIAWVIRHYLMYVVLKSDGQSNHHLIIIMMMMMMMMMIMVTVTVMVMTMIMIMIIIILAVYIALMLVHPSKCLKQIIQKKLNRVKNRNWLGANQLAILQAWTTVNKSSYRSGRDLNSGPPNCKSSALTTRSRCLHRFLLSSLLHMYWSVLLIPKPIPQCNWIQHWPTTPK